MIIRVPVVLHLLLRTPAQDRLEPFIYPAGPAPGTLASPNALLFPAWTADSSLLSSDFRHHPEPAPGSSSRAIAANVALLGGCASEPVRYCQIIEHRYWRRNDE